MTTTDGEFVIPEHDLTTMQSAYRKAVPKFEDAELVTAVLAMADEIHELRALCREARDYLRSHGYGHTDVCERLRAKVLY